MRLHKITNVANPVNPQDGATKAYVDRKIVEVLRRMGHSDDEIKKAGLKL